MTTTLRTLLDRVEQGEGADWIDHDGGDYQVHPMTIVRARYRGDADPSKGVRIDWPVCAARLDWSHDGGPDDIVAYRIEESALLRAKIAQEGEQ